MDEWGNYPHERKLLFDLIESTDARRVALLSGNVHFSEVSHTDEGRYPLYDFTASGLTHVNEGYAEAPNPYRVVGPVTEVNFGVVNIDWNDGLPPDVRLQVLDRNGAVVLDYTVSPADTEMS